MCQLHNPNYEITFLNHSLQLIIVILLQPTTLICLYHSEHLAYTTMGYYGANIDLPPYNGVNWFHIVIV